MVDAMSDPEVEAILAAWRSDQSYQQRSARTIDEREAFLRRYFDRTKIRPLHETPESIKRFVSTAARDGQQIKPGTQWLYQQHFRAYCRWLVLTDRRIDNPMEKLPPISKPRGLPKPVTEQELARLLRAAQGDTRTMILFGAFAGLRVHEIAKLHGKDLDWDTWKLRVTGKRGKTSVLDLHPVLRDSVADYPRAKFWFPVRDDNGKPTSKPIAPADVSTAIRKVMRAAGVDATAHQLRHRYGTILLEQTGNLRTVHGTDAARVDRIHPDLHGTSRRRCGPRPSQPCPYPPKRRRTDEAFHDRGGGGAAAHGRRREGGPCGSGHPPAGMVARTMSDEVDERRVVAIASPDQLRGAAAQLRSVSPVQAATQPFGRVLGARAVRVIADALDECARLRTSTASAREKRLEERVDQLAILATSRRLPLAAIEGIVRRADEAGRDVVFVEEIRRALAATEPKS
jgi:integrase/recombinase XerD